MGGKILKIYFIMLHIFVITMLFKGYFISIMPNILNNQYTPEISNYYNTLVKFHLRGDANTPNGSYIFIGDSVVQGLATSAVANPSVNYGINGDTTMGVKQRILKYDSIHRSSSVILLIGVNDLTRRSNDEILKNYDEILNFLSNNAKNTYVNSILPVDNEINGINKNDNINILNKEIKNLSKKYPNVHFVNVYPYLADNNNNLQDKYHIGDGLHLNSKGYNVWIKILQENIL